MSTGVASQQVRKEYLGLELKSTPIASALINLQFVAAARLLAPSFETMAGPFSLFDVDLR